ncbi:MAG: J domain-containing protein [Rhodococcus sp.]|uniref:J domain-containing protein n=1 Tax=Rhodococcus sp. SMB37 TaxID=2512213 RepID=UPI00104ABCFD|nr:J domain-containing protein [Rhodococcus sp. SMB37]NLE82573.1 J domain-containing protein [Rhodococcus sp. (in: high G+C Gram-positive bacteria)]TCN51267.1 molecular chaperone DnaJ [Rhodococcus sp. SMB37]
MTTECDPYRVLGLLPSASRAEVTSAYRRLLRAHHPDTRTTGRDTAEQCDDEILRQILAAYELLRDPQRRASHERTVTRPDTRARERSPREHSSPDGNTPPIRTDVADAGTSPPRRIGPFELWVGPVRRHR